MNNYIKELKNSLNVESPVTLTVGGYFLNKKNEAVSYLKEYYKIDDQGKFLYKVKDLYKKYGITQYESQNLFDEGGVQSQVKCRFCGENMFIPFLARTNIPRNIPSKKCLCGHTENSYCSCHHCRREKLIKKSEMFRERQWYFEEILDDSKGLGRDLDLKEVVELTWEIRTFYTEKEKGRFNYKNIQYLGNLKLLTSASCIEPDWDDFFKPETIEEVEEMASYSSFAPLYYFQYLDLNVEKVTQVLRFLCEVLLSEEKEVALEIIGDNKREVLTLFITKVGSQLGFELNDIKDVTIDNIFKVQAIMGFSKTLYATQMAIKNGFSYCAQNGIYGKFRRNLIIGLLNKMHEKYNNQGWTPPERGVEDWELAEKYDIDAQSEKFNLVKKLSRELDKVPSGELEYALDVARTTIIGEKWEKLLNS